MSAAVLRLHQPREGRATRDRLELVTALLGGPSVDPLFREPIIQIPLGHPVYRWDCLVDACGRPRSGYTDLCGGHLDLWHLARRAAGASTRAEFVAAAEPLGPGPWVQECPCRICPQRPARHVSLRLCDKHQFRWFRHRQPNADGADFDAWLADQHPFAGYGGCRVRVCPDAANSPLGLCARHEHRYRAEGSPGGARLPSQWANRYERRGLATPVDYRDETGFVRWCSTTVPVLRPGQVNLLGLAPLVRAEIQWGLFMRTRAAGSRCELPWVQSLANFCQRHAILSLTDLDLRPDAPLRAVGREIPAIVQEMVDELGPIYLSPGDTREQGFLVTDHFGVRFTGRPGRIDLTGVPQPWLRNLLWDYIAGVLRSPRCPRSPHPLDNIRRAGLELGVFLDIHAPGGGHDPTVLREEHMTRFVADLRHREREGLPSIAATGRHGAPSIITGNWCRNIFNYTRSVLRDALDSGHADELGLHRAFITAMPTAGVFIRRVRSPFPDDVARALADEANLQRLATVYDPFDRGLRDAWETIIVTGRRCGEVLKLRLDCLGRYGGLPMLWHDQTKVGNYDQAIRIPERLHQLLTERQHKTLAAFDSDSSVPISA